MRLFNHTNFDIILSTSTIFSIFVVIVLSDWSLLTPSFMTDIKTPEERSRNMSAIKSNDTKPEMIVRRYLHGLGYRYGLHNKRLPGRPDIVLRRYKTIIFVNGCFWHGHENCKYYRLPKSNTDFWQTKIAQNRARDERDIKELVRLGWHVIVIWECELKTEKTRQQTFRGLLEKLNFSYLLTDYPLIAAAEPEAIYGKNSNI